MVDLKPQMVRLVESPPSLVNFISELPPVVPGHCPSALGVPGRHGWRPPLVSGHQLRQFRAGRRCSSLKQPGGEQQILDPLPQGPRDGLQRPEPGGLLPILKPD